MFIYLFNLDIHRLNTAANIYRAAMKHFNVHSAACPGCKTKGHLSTHGEYSHHLVDYYGKQVQEGAVGIDRVTCSSCGAAPSVLPDLLVPHKSYSILFIMLVLRAALIRTVSIETLCKRYGIAVSTYYRWKNLFRTYKSLHLGKLEKYLYEKDPFLTGTDNICTTCFLYEFYQRFGFSFLQYSKTAESRSP